MFVHAALSPAGTVTRIGWKPVLVIDTAVVEAATLVAATASVGTRQRSKSNRFIVETPSQVVHKRSSRWLLEERMEAVRIR